MINTNRVRQKRRSRWWTQQDLAGFSGVSLRTIHSIEKGNECRSSTKRKVASALFGPHDLESSIALLFLRSEEV